MPGNGDKDPTKAEGDMGTQCDARQQTRDQSQERQATMDWAITDALVRNTFKLTAKFMALFNERVTMNMPTSLKTSSGATRISAMPPFVWIEDKTIYQHWQALVFPIKTTAQSRPQYPMHMSTSHLDWFCSLENQLPSVSLINL